MQLAISGFATTANAATINIEKPISHLEVKLEMVGNAGVKARITNTRGEDLEVYKTGSFLKKIPAEKVKVARGNSKVAFNGVRLCDQARPKGVCLPSHTHRRYIAHVFVVAEPHDLSAASAIGMVSEGRATTSHANTKRQEVRRDCTASEESVTVDTINAYADLVLQAASVAETEIDELIKYFKNTDSSTSPRVVDVFNAVAPESSSTSSRALRNPV
ncbi:hypothetical protein F5Y07DRAFT_395426 [Xylaria sp. FL0933]|nr:hypothetical protein F5Y07DRAFT_395426 [Xylaria sp. FL0933]